MNRRYSGLLVCLLLLFVISACAVPMEVVLETMPAPTNTPALTLTPTETIQWFPATATPPLRPTRTVIPTADRRPGISDVLLEDDFSGASGWATLQSQSGNVALGNGQLTIAVASPGETLFSLRSAPNLENFYLEINASPNLCKAYDSYGLILRSGEAGAAYRFAVNCSGLINLEIVQNNRTQEVLQDWTPSGQVPVGAPARVRLGVWAYADEMRFFVNDVFQFSVQADDLREGLVGVFARSEGTTAVTVSFSDLVVYSLGSVPPAPAPTMTPPLSSATPTVTE